MLERLLESRFKSTRSVGGAVASVTGHTALIAAALYATAQTHTEHRDSVEVAHISYVPTHAAAVGSLGPRIALVPARLRRIAFIDVKIPNVAPLPIGTDYMVARPGDFSPVVTAGNAGDGSGPASPSPDGVFQASQVERQVTVAPGRRPPRYPEPLRLAGVEGEIVATFVVDEEGRVEEGTIRFVRADNELFERAVRETLRQMRFIPAEIAGRKVRQLVQMPFVFRLSR
jgi:protein TonB